MVKAVATKAMLSSEGWWTAVGVAEESAGSTVVATTVKVVGWYY